MATLVPSRRALALPALAIVTVASLSACGGAPSGGDFSKKAEEFIDGDLNDDPGLNGVTLSGAECDQPESTETGTTFSCTATASDGQARTLTVNITGRNEFTIVDIQPPLPAAPTASTTPTTATG